jgi:type II secretory pathway pseudopilin PulG
MKNKGFTLIELVIFISVFSIFFITATGIALSTLRNTKIAKERILATRSAQEAMDWLDSVKQQDWEKFYKSAVSSTANLNASRYCPSLFNLTCQAGNLCGLPTQSGSTLAVRVINVIRSDIFTAPSSSYCTGATGTTGPFVKTILLQNSGSQGSNLARVNAKVVVSWTTLGRSNVVELNKTFKPYE